MPHRLSLFMWRALPSLLLAISWLGWPLHVPGAGADSPAGQAPLVTLPAGAWGPLDPPQRPAGVQAVTHPIPRTGDQWLLIVLVDFPDRPGLFTGQDWQQFFFGPGGFADFYKEVSYNQLRYAGTVVGISAGVPVTNSNSVAYVRLPHPITYYAAGMEGFNNTPGQFPQNSSGMVDQAL